MSLLIALGLCLIGFLAIILEFFVPAGGIVGIVGLGTVISGVVMVYVNYGPAYGNFFLLGSAILFPLIMAVYFRTFPRSFVGRKLILGSSSLHQNPDKKREKKKHPLLGKRGVALTILRPAGMAKIDGEKYSVVTAGEFIEPGTDIEVSAVEGNRIIVEKGV